jgi:hypothetical protein
MSINSSSPLSTRRLTEGGRRTALVGAPVPLVAHSAHRWHRARRQQYAQQVSLWQICGLNSTVAARVRTIASLTVAEVMAPATVVVSISNIVSGPGSRRRAPPLSMDPGGHDTQEHLELHQHRDHSWPQTCPGEASRQRLMR